MENLYILVNNEKIIVEENTLIKINRNKKQFLKNIRDAKSIVLIGNPIIDSSFLNYCSLKKISVFFITKSGKFKGYFFPDFQKHFQQIALGEFSQVLHHRR